MKKLLSFLAAGALALGLIGCSGNLHDDEYKLIDLSNGAIPGDFESPANWDNTTPWSEIDAENNTYTFNFKTKADLAGNVGFKILTKSGEWNVDGYTEVDISVDSDAVIMPMKTADAMGGAGNANIVGCKAGANYTMTVVANPDTTISVKVESAGASAVPADPVPYYFDGELFVGCAAIGNNFNIADTSWLLYGCTLDKKTGEVTYTKDFTASVCGDPWHTGDAVVKIADPNWKNSYGDTAITVGGDFVKLVAGGDNAPVSGLVDGKAYRAEIKTTPDKDVLIKIYEIASVTFKFEVTGLSEGELAWIGGQFWGAGWDNGWPIEAWKKPVGCGLSVSDNAVADENGVAAFNNKWNVSTVAKPGETLSYNFKAIASTSNWEGESPTSHETGDLSVDIEIEEDATYKISINIEDEEITVTKL